MSDWYVLDAGNRPVKRPDILSGPGDEMVETMRLVRASKGRVHLKAHVNGYWISTVFLGLDHSWGNEPPALFETMAFPAVFGRVTGWGEDFCRRYSTVAQAAEGHCETLAQYRTRCHRLTQKFCDWVDGLFEKK